jgi:heat shock protein HslJ
MLAAAALALAFATQADLAGSSWRLTGISGFTIPPRARAATLSFGPGDRFDGYDGCNGFGASWRLEQGRFAWDGIVTTMGCRSPDDPLLMARAEAFRRALDDAEARTNGKVLEFRGRKGVRIRMRRIEEGFSK